MNAFMEWFMKDDWFFVSPLDWLIIIIPTAFVLYMGWVSKRYVVQVTDFLSAGRLCGRYVISVGDVAEALSIMGIVAAVEMNYRNGFALSFWHCLKLPLSIALSLTGFVIYRYRETKALSYGQMLEMRYGSRNMRIFAGLMRSVSEILANIVMPAVAGRFFIYYLGLPLEFEVCGITFQSFNLIIIISLVMSIGIICMGGTLALSITDCIQGMLCYPILAVFAAFLLIKFSWWDQIVPVLNDRVPKESFLNPFDISELRDFNVFMVLLGMISSVANRGSWVGSGGSSAAKSPHEQKMANLLGTFRGGFSGIFYFMIVLGLIVYLNHKDFRKEAKEVRDTISTRVAEDIMRDKPELRARLHENIKTVPEISHDIGIDKPLSDKDNLDTDYLAHIYRTINDESEFTRAESAEMRQQFKTLYVQMMTAVGMRHMMPPGLSGLFCLLMIMAMISTDDTRIYSAALTVAQDVVLPFVKKPLTPEQHIRLIRIVSITLGVIFYVGATNLKQLDYITLTMTTMTTLWIGAGAMSMMGLYSRFGTRAGAWSSLLSTMGLAFLYILMKQNWSEFYYFLEEKGLLAGFSTVIEGMSRPFEPYVVWRVNPQKCFINPYEFNFIAMVLAYLIYIVVSKLTCKEPFNLDRMLHRGKYNLDNRNLQKTKWTWKTFFSKIIGITPEYTFWDRFIARAVVVYSFGYRFFGTFLLVLIWNMFQEWPEMWWGRLYFITSLVVPGIMATFVTFWFGIGSVIDMRQLFIDLKNRKINFLDNGQVSGNMALADKAELEELDKEKKKTADKA